MIETILALRGLSWINNLAAPVVKMLCLVLMLLCLALLLNLGLTKYKLNSVQKELTLFKMDRINDVNVINNATAESVKVNQAKANAAEEKAIRSNNDEKKNASNQLSNTLTVLLRKSRLFFLLPVLVLTGCQPSTRLLVKPQVTLVVPPYLLQKCQRLDNLEGGTGEHIVDWFKTNIPEHNKCVIRQNTLVDLIKDYQGK